MLSQYLECLMRIEKHKQIYQNIRRSKMNVLIPVTFRFLPEQPLLNRRWDNLSWHPSNLRVSPWPWAPPPKVRLLLLGKMKKVVNGHNKILNSAADWQQEKMVKFNKSIEMIFAAGHRLQVARIKARRSWEMWFRVRRRNEGTDTMTTLASVKISREIVKINRRLMTCKDLSQQATKSNSNPKIY